MSPDNSRGGPLTTDRPTAENPGTKFTTKRTTRSSEEIDGSADPVRGSAPLHGIDAARPGPAQAAPASKTHLALVVPDGTVIALPMTAWLDQTFARAVLAKAGADLPPPLDDDDWLDLVFVWHDNAEKAA